AKANSPPLDVRFRIFQEERSMQQELRVQDLGRSSLDLTSYVEYSSMERQAKRSHVAALVALKSFWAYFNTEGATDIGRLGTLLENMHKTEQDASNFYEKLLRVRALLIDLPPLSPSAKVWFPSPLIGSKTLTTCSLDTPLSPGIIVAFSEKQDYFEREYRRTLKKRKAVSAFREEVPIMSALHRHHLRLATGSNSGRNVFEANLNQSSFFQFCPATTGRKLAFFFWQSAPSQILPSPSSYSKDTLHDTTKGRTAAMGAVQELRMMIFSAKMNQTQNFDLHRKNLHDIRSFYNEFVIPSLEEDHDQDIEILLWDGVVSNSTGVMEPLIRNTYSLSVLISESVSTVLDYEIDTFSSDEINEDPDIRTIMMNIERIGEALDTYVQDVGERTFIEKGESDLKILLALFGINVTVMFGMVLLLEYMVWKTRKESFKLLNLFMLVPKRAQKAMIANLDEEIDLLTDANEVDEKQLCALQNRESQKRISPLWRARLIYVLGMAITAAFCCTLNVTPVQRLSAGISTANLIVTSDSRRYLAMLKTAHQKLLEGRSINADELIHNYEIIKYTKANPNFCLLAKGCVDQVFNVSIGFTGQLVSSGLDLLISRYVSEAEELIHSYAKNGFQDQHFLLIRAILPYILDGLDSVTALVLNKEIVEARSSTNVQSIIFGLS
ncbi:hypothetical protein HK102_003742, partial [Quaeritorhiza haematococci]